MCVQTVLIRIVAAFIAAVFCAIPIAAQGQVPDPPAIVLPAVGEVGRSSAYVTVTWTSTGQQGYQVLITATNSPAGPALFDSGIKAGTAKQQYSGPLPSPANVFIFVRVSNGSGWSAWSTSRRYTLFLAAPMAPSITFPTANAVIASNYFSVSWSGDPSSFHQIRICTAATPDAPNIWDSGELPTATQAPIGPFPRTGTYYLFVRLKNDFGWGNWSAARAFSMSVPLRIIPEPQQLIYTQGQSFLPGSFLRIIVPQNATERTLFTASLLKRALKETCNTDSGIEEYSSGISASGAISLGTITDGVYNNPLAEQTIIAYPESAGKAAKKEGSMLAISSDRIAVAGYDEHGLFFGVQSIIQLLEQQLGAPVPGMFVYDYPTLNRRGVLLRWWGLYGSYDAEFAEEWVREMYTRFKLNTLQMEIRLGMYYDTAPLLNYATSATTKQQTSDLVKMMKRYNLDVIAGGVSTTHADQWITDRYPQLAIPGIPYDLDMQNPATVAFVEGLINELIEVVDPEIIHVGGDEGAAGITRSYNAILYLRNYNAARGRKTAIWGDMIKDNGLFSSLPKDIFVQDWEYNSSHTDFPDLQLWTANGIKAWTCPYGVYVNNNVPGPNNIFYSATSAQNYGSDGLMAFNKAILGERNRTIFADNTVGHNDYALSNYTMYPFYGEWGWTPGKPSSNPLPYDGRHMFMRQFAPEKPTGLQAVYNQNKVTLTFAGPINAATKGAVVVYRYDRPPVSIADGYFLQDVRLTRLQTTTVEHPQPANGQTAYYGVFIYDPLRNFSPPAVASVTAGLALKVSDAKSANVGEVVAIGDAIVSAVFSDRYYVQQADRSSGICIIDENPSVNVGDIIKATGMVSEIDSELVIHAESVQSTGQTISPLPLRMTNRLLGGGQTLHQKAVWSADKPAEGLNNVGLFVWTTGRITYADPSGIFFYIDDGSACDDGSGNTGVKVAGDGRSFTPGTMLSVIAASSCETGSTGKAVRLLRPVSSTVIEE